MPPEAGDAPLHHVRWIAGGTGAGKSTVTALLARDFDVTVYDGDRGEAAYIARASANWGDADPAEMLRRRLARDELWDAEVRRQARAFSLPVIDVDGTTTPEALAARLATAFALPERP